MAVVISISLIAQFMSLNKTITETEASPTDREYNFGHPKLLKYVYTVKHTKPQNNI